MPKPPRKYKGKPGQRAEPRAVLGTPAEETALAVYLWRALRCQFGLKVAVYTDDQEYFNQKALEMAERLGVKKEYLALLLDNEQIVGVRIEGEVLKMKVTS